MRQIDREIFSLVVNESASYFASDSKVKMVGPRSQLLKAGEKRLTNDLAIRRKSCGG